MVFAIQADLAFRNASRRDNISDNIQTYIAGEPAVSLEVRFTTRAEQDAAWADIQAFIGTGINGPVTGSTIYRHDCLHDQPRPPLCVVAERRDY
jgi:hypothetical protein